VSAITLQLSSLKKELEVIKQQLQRTERLIHIADPDGWYKPPGSSSSAAAAGGDVAAAAAAAARAAAAKQALEADRQRRAAAVAAQRAGWAAAHVSVCLRALHLALLVVHYWQCVETGVKYLIAVLLIGEAT
jgi:hypothetical protein